MSIAKVIIQRPRKDVNDQSNTGDKLKKKQEKIVLMVQCCNIWGHPSWYLLVQSQHLIYQKNLKSFQS